MSDCGREWDKDDTCNGCWAVIFQKTMQGENPILPQPDFCQDAAWVAWVLDERYRLLRSSESRH